MNLSEPTRLRQHIRQIVKSYYRTPPPSYRNFKLDSPRLPSKAIEVLVKPGLSGSWDLSNVDAGRLRESIADVLEQLDVPRSRLARVTPKQMMKALARGKCHYLWFC